MFVSESIVIAHEISNSEFCVTSAVLNSTSGIRAGTTRECQSRSKVGTTRDVSGRDKLELMNGSE